MLKLIVWNKTVFCIKMDLALNNLPTSICHKNPNKQENKSVRGVSVT